MRALRHADRKVSRAMKLDGAGLNHSHGRWKLRLGRRWHRCEACNLGNERLGMLVVAKDAPGAVGPSQAGGVGNDCGRVISIHWQRETGHGLTKVDRHWMQVRAVPDTAEALDICPAVTMLCPRPTSPWVGRGQLAAWKANIFFSVRGEVEVVDAEYYCQ